MNAAERQAVSLSGSVVCASRECPQVVTKHAAVRLAENTSTVNLLY